MKRFLLSKNGWLLRAISAAVLLVVIALSLLPGLVSHISTSAVVNASVMIIRSPLEGVVETYNLRTGSVVTRGQSVVTLREARTDLTRQAVIETRMQIADAAAHAVRTRIVDVEALRDRLVERHASYSDWQTRIMESEAQEVEALLDSARAREDALARRLGRVAKLRKQGVLPDSVATEVATKLAEERGRIAELDARLNTRRLKLEAMRQGVLTGSTGTDAPYPFQRQHEIELELSALRDELADHLAEAAATRAQLAKEREIFQRDNQVALNAPIGGIVWRSAASSGQPVLPGDEILEILDCGSRFLEAYLPEGLMGSIAVGDLADVRLTGTTRTFQAPVVSILGHGARFDHVELAAQDNTPKTGKMRVLIQLSKSDLGADAGLFCHVGRTAQVSLPRDVWQLAGVLDQLRTSLRTAAQWIDTAPTDLGRG